MVKNKQAYINTLGEEKKQFYELINDERDQFRQTMNRWFAILTVVMGIIGLIVTIFLITNAVEIHSTVKQVDAIVDTVKLIRPELNVIKRRVYLLETAIVDKKMNSIQHTILYLNIMDLRAIMQRDYDESKRLNIEIKQLERKRFRLEIGGDTVDRGGFLISDK
jgi:hypothetical protein